MAEVERLLTGTLVEIGAVDPAHHDAEFCLQQYAAELGRRFETGFDPALSISAGVDELRPPAGAFLVATLRSEPVGCGALKFHGEQPTELKRMWVAESARGLGIGRRLLSELESRAAVAGAGVVGLETNKALTEAISLYRSAATARSMPNDRPYAHHWFEEAAGGGSAGRLLTPPALTASG
jgi:GNAT superfamily N-acetyltransferase